MKWSTGGIWAHQVAELSFCAVELKVLLSLEPIVETAPMMATAINDTSRPYSTALAPDSSLQKFLIRSIFHSPCPAFWFFRVIFGLFRFLSSFFSLVVNPRFFGPSPPFQ
jgi:hypothetical protein